MKRIVNLNVLICLLLIVSCKKYEEGPWFSFRGVDKRVQGFWDLEYLFIGDVDSTAAVKSQLCSGLLFLNTLYDINHAGVWSLENENTSCKHCKGEWVFSKDKRDLFIEHPSKDTCSFKSVGPFLATNYIKWKIYTR